MADNRPLWFGGTADVSKPTGWLDYQGARATNAIANLFGGGVKEGQAPAAPAAPAQPSALEMLMKQRQDAADAVHNRANPYAGNAWQTGFNQQAQGFAGQGAQAEAAGLARAGATGSQMGLVAQAAARQQQANALSALRANTQQRYQEMGNQYQQAQDRDYQNALGGIYSDQAHQAELAYQHDEAANKNVGGFFGNVLSAGGQILSSPVANTALQALLKGGMAGNGGQTAAAPSYASYGADGDTYGPTPGASNPVYPTPTGQPYQAPTGNPYLKPPAPSYGGGGDFHLGGGGQDHGWGFGPNGFKLGGF